MNVHKRVKTILQTQQPHDNKIDCLVLFTFSPHPCNCFYYGKVRRWDYSSRNGIGRRSYVSVGVEVLDEHETKETFSSLLGNSITWVGWTTISDDKNYDVAKTWFQTEKLWVWGILPPPSIFFSLVSSYTDSLITNKSYSSS